MTSVRDADVHNKIVLLRADFNVPLKDAQITDDNRIRQSLPTIQYLIEKGAKIVICTHVGRPKVAEYEEALSTVPTAQRLAQLLNRKVYVTDQVTGLEVKAKIDSLKNGDILILGNLRFNPGEELNEDNFARELASLGQLYINDAFAVSHRANASIDAITKFLPSYSGFLLESEVTTLKLLMENPEHPFILVVGGVKVEDKAGLLKNLAAKADKILIGGAVSTTFLAAKGENVSKSLYDKEMIGLCKDILRDFADKIILPVDSKDETINENEFKILDIGPKTIESFTHEINNANSVFWNGNMGYTEDEKYTAGTVAIAKAMASKKNTTVIAGGDTAGFVISHNLAEGISFISTGGGSAMQFLSGKKLPGVIALERKPK